MSTKPRKKKNPKIRILYYQARNEWKEINFIYSMENKYYVSELRRTPYEEGLVPFFKKSGAHLLSSEIDIHEFAAHLTTAYKSKKKK